MNQFFQAQGDRWPHVDQLQHQILRPQQAPAASNWATIPSLYQQQQMAMQQLQQQQLQQQQLLHQQQMQQQQRLQEQFGLAAQSQHAANTMGGQHLGLGGPGNHQPSMTNNTPSLDYYVPNQNNGSTGPQPPAAPAAAAQRTLPNQSLVHESILRQPQSTPVTVTPNPAPAPALAPPPAPAPARTSFTPNPGAALFRPGAAPTLATTSNQLAATRNVPAASGVSAAPAVSAVSAAPAPPTALGVPAAPNPTPPQAPRQPTPQPTITTTTKTTHSETAVVVTDYSRPRRRSPVQIRLPNQRSAFITELPSRTGSERSKSPPKDRPPAADHLRPTQVAPPASAKTSPAVPQPSTGKKLDGLTYVWNRPELQQPSLTAAFPKQGATTNPPPARPKSSRYEPDPAADPTAPAAESAATATPHRKTPFAEMNTPPPPQEQRYDRAGWPKPLGAEDSPPSPKTAETLLPAIDIVRMSPTPEKRATGVPRGGRTKEGDDDTRRRSQDAASLQNLSRRQRVRENRLNERASDRGSERGWRDSTRRTEGHGINDIPSSFQMMSGTTLRYVPGTATVEARWEEALSKTARRKLARQEREQGEMALETPQPSATTSAVQTDTTSPRQRSRSATPIPADPLKAYGRDVAKYAQGGYGRYSPKPEDLVPYVPPAPKPSDKEPPISPQEKVQHEAVLALLSDVNDKLRSKDGIYTSRALDLASSPGTAASTRVPTAVPTIQPASPSGRSTPLSPSAGVYESTAPTQANRDDCASSAESWRREPAQTLSHYPPTPLDTFRLLATGEPRRARDTGVLEGFRIVADMFTAFSQLTAAHVDMVRMLTSPNATPTLRQTIEPTLCACSHHLDALHHTLLLTSHIRAEHVRSAWVELGAQPPEF